MLTAQQVAEKWKRNFSQAGQAMQEAVQAVTENPMEAAARNKQAYIDGVTRAYNSGRYEAGLRKVSLDDWRRAMITKGIPHATQAATTAAPNVAAFMERWLPYEQTLKQRIKAMPKGSLADSKARADFAIEYNAAFAGRTM